jgi:hypothetical protein
MKMRVVIPEERLLVVEFRQEGRPGVACLNSSLVDFEPKIVFRWHLSVWMVLTDLIDNGMPSQAQRDLVDPFGDSLDAMFKGSIEDKPNAMFLGRLTWNGSRELIYRVYDPEPVDVALQVIIRKAQHPCAFDFRMDDDPQWKLAEWHLRAARPNPPQQPTSAPTGDRA